MEFGPSNWQKVCFVPTKADALVVAFRRWLIRYSQGQVNWGDNFNAAALPPTPSREQLFDRYLTSLSLPTPGPLLYSFRKSSNNNSFGQDLSRKVFTLC